MPIEVEVPDVGVFEFPDEYTEDQIQQILSARPWEQQKNVVPEQPEGRPLYVGPERESETASLTDLLGYVFPGGELESKAGIRVMQPPGIALPLVYPPKGQPGVLPKIAQVGAGTYNTLASIPNFMLTPEGAAVTAATAAAGPPGALAAKGIFSGLMAHEAGQRLGQASVTGDIQDWTEGIGAGALGGTIPFGRGMFGQRQVAPTPRTQRLRPAEATATIEGSNFERRGQSWFDESGQVVTDEGLIGALEKVQKPTGRTYIRELSEADNLLFDEASKGYEVEFVRPELAEEGQAPKGLQETNQIAWPTKSGKIAVNPEALATHLQRMRQAGIPEARINEFLRELFTHEKIHTGVTDEQAGSYWSKLTALERWIAEKIYLPEGEARDPSIITDTMMGHEVIRRRVQRINKMTPGEFLQTIGTERWTLQGLEALETVVRGLRENVPTYNGGLRRGTQAARDQAAILDDVLMKIGEAKVFLSRSEQPTEERPEDAIQVKGPDGLPVRQLPQAGEEMGAQVRGPEGPAGAQAQAQAEGLAARPQPRPGPIRVPVPGAIPPPMRSTKHFFPELSKEVLEGKPSEEVPFSLSKFPKAEEISKWTPDQVDTWIRERRAEGRFNEQDELPIAREISENREAYDAMSKAQKEARDKTQSLVGEMKKEKDFDKQMAMVGEVQKWGLKSQTLREIIELADEVKVPTEAPDLIDKIRGTIITISDTSPIGTRKTIKWNTAVGDVEIEVVGKPSSATRQDTQRVVKVIGRPATMSKRTARRIEELQKYRAAITGVQTPTTLQRKLQPELKLPMEEREAPPGAMMPYQQPDVLADRFLSEVKLPTFKGMMAFLKRNLGPGAAKREQLAELGMERLKQFLPKATPEQLETLREITGLEGDPGTMFKKRIGYGTGKVPQIPVRVVTRKQGEIGMPVVDREAIANDLRRQAQDLEDAAKRMVQTRGEEQAALPPGQEPKKFIDQLTMFGVPPETLQAKKKGGKRLLEQKHPEVPISPGIEQPPKAPVPRTIQLQTSEEMIKKAKGLRAQAASVESGGAINMLKAPRAAGLTEAEKAQRSGQKYRNKLISAIVTKWEKQMKRFLQLGQIDRKTFDIDDIDFLNPDTTVGAYRKISPEDAKSPTLVSQLLRDQARGHSDMPESASHRLLTVVDRKTGAVYMLSTYNDAGVQRVTDPYAPQIKGGKHTRELNEAFLRQFQPIASVLLEAPIRNFKKRFESVREYTEKVDREASAMDTIEPNEYTISPEEMGEIEGTEGLRGGRLFVGSYKSKHKAPPGEMMQVPATLDVEAPLTDVEAGNLLATVMERAGKWRDQSDFYRALESLREDTSRERMTPQDRQAISALNKIFDRITTETPGLEKRLNSSNEEVAAKAEEELFDLAAGKTTRVLSMAGMESAKEGGMAYVFPNEARFVELLMKEFGEAEGKPLVGPQGSPTARELEMRRPAPTLEQAIREARIKAGLEKVPPRWSSGQGGLVRYPEKPELQERTAEGPKPIEFVDEPVIVGGVEKGFKRVPYVPGRGVYEQIARDWFEGFRPQKPGQPSKPGDMPFSMSKLTDLLRGPSLLRPEAIFPDTDSPIPRFISNVENALTRAYGWERIPLIGRLYGKRASVRSPVDRVIIGYAAKRNIGKSTAAIRGMQMAAFDEAIGNPWKQDKNGMIQNLDAPENVSRAPADVFELWQEQTVVPQNMVRAGVPREVIEDYKAKHPKTIRLTPEQTADFLERLRFYKDGFKYLEEKQAKLQGYGAEGFNLGTQLSIPGFEESRIYPMNRVALYKRSIGPTMDLLQRQILGSKYDINRERKYKSEKEGQEKIFYEPDMNKRLAAFIERVYKAVADGDIANAKELQGMTYDQHLEYLARRYEGDLRSGEKSIEDIKKLAKGELFQEEATVPGHAAFADKFYPIEVAKKLQRAFSHSPPRWLQALANISGAMKSLTLTGDVSQWTQQGGLLMTRRPLAWATAVTKSAQSIGKGTTEGQYMSIAENAKAAIEFIHSNGSLGHLPEFLAGAVPRELAAEIPIVKHVVQRGGRAFGTFIDIAKIELWKAQSPHYPREQWPALAEAIENQLMTGKTAAAGMTPGRQLAENLAMTAASYYRGAFDLIGKLAEKGAGRQEAMKSLGSYFAAWYGTMMAAYLASGMSWNEIKERLTPGSKNEKFLSYPIKIGDRKFELGPGGMMIQLASLITDVATTDPANFVKWGEDNPLIEFAHRKTGPLPSGAYEIYSGEDILGRPTSPVKSAKQRAAPLPMQNFFEIAKRENKPLGFTDAIASFVGLRTGVSSSLYDIQQKAREFEKEKGLKKATGWELQQIDEASYKRLRAAIAAGDKSIARDVFEKLRVGREPKFRKGSFAKVDPIVEYMGQWVNSPFTSSKQNDAAFYKTLSAEDRKKWEEAKAERRKVYTRFKQWYPTVFKKTPSVQ